MADEVEVIESPLEPIRAEHVTYILDQLSVKAGLLGEDVERWIEELRDTPYEKFLIDALLELEKVQKASLAKSEEVMKP